MTYPSFDEVAVKRAMISAGADVTLLADGTKSGRASMVRVAPLTELNRIITSQPISASEQSKIRDLGVELIIAGASDGPERNLAEPDEAQPQLAQPQLAEPGSVSAGDPR
jgi:hypothetical protein